MSDEEEEVPFQNVTNMTTSNVDSPSEEIESLLKLNMKKLSVLD